MRSAEFFAYARERHSIYLRRAAGVPRGTWTTDPVLSTYRFCNVFRELDRTTVWFRENVREGLRDDRDVLLATVLFRWFNRIATGEAIFSQRGISSFGDGSPCKIATAWDLRHGAKAKWFGDHLRGTIRNYCGKGPYVTGSYIIKTPDGMNKLDGVLWCVEQFMLQTQPAEGREYGWEMMAHTCDEMAMSGQPVRMETVWSWLSQFPYLGPFMAYEVVTDLRHTALLDRAPDIMTWANPGPGAFRGLNRIHGRELDKRVPRAQAISEMRELLALSQDDQYWPNMAGTMHEVPGDFSDWPAWEMREVEHTLCEFDKIERVRLGQGTPRQKFR